MEVLEDEELIFLQRFAISRSSKRSARATGMHLVHLYQTCRFRKRSWKVSLAIQSSWRSIRSIMNVCILQFCGCPTHWDRDSGDVLRFECSKVMFRLLSFTNVDLGHD
jgi:hypothetical protein